MNKEAIIFGQVQGGQLGVYNVHTWHNYLKHWEGADIHVVLRDPLLKYNHRLLGYYFHVMIPQVLKCFRSFGHQCDAHDVDQTLRQMFLTEQVHDPDADQWITVIRTLAKDKTTVTTTQFMEFVHQVIAWVIEVFDWAIPYPGEVLRPSDLEPMGCLSAMTEYQRTA